MSPLWKKELRELIKLSIPLVTVQVGMMALGFVDVFMVGQLPAEQAEQALAAVGLGNFYNLLLSMLGIGVLMALDPVISQAVAAKDHKTVSRNLQRGIVMAVVLFVPLGLLHLPTTPVLRLLHQPEQLLEPTTNYVWILIPGVLPFLLGVVFRVTLQAQSKVAPIVWTILITNALNVFLNWLWIYGNWGFEAMGVEGSAWATLVCRWCLAIGMLFFGWRWLAPYLRPFRRACLAIDPLKRALRLGMPIGLQLMLEFGAFGGTLVFMGWFGEIQQSGHQVAITLATFSYMFPLGMSFAASVRVGYGVGLADISRSRAAAGNSIVLSTVIMSCFAVVFLVFPEQLASMFTTSDRVREIAAVLLPVAGVFQIVDGVQVIGVGILRGLGDTRAALEANILGFWVIGIPCGLWMAFSLGMGPPGLWWGLVIGLSAVAIYLLVRVHYRLRGDVSRTVL